MKKKLIAITIVIAVIGGYFWSRDDASEEQKKAQWNTVEVQKGDISLTVSCTGQIVSNLDVEIKSKASGEVVKLPFDVSDKVKKGDLLVELDPVDEQRKVNQAKISLASSEARLMQSKVSLETARENLATEEQSAKVALKAAQASADDAVAKAKRMQELLDKKLASQEEKDTAETSSAQAEAALENARLRVNDLKVKERDLEIQREDIKLAEAQVENDKINLSLAEQRLTDTKVFSSLDGVVSERNIQIGQIISSGISNVGGGTLLMVVSDLSHLFIEASVDESDIGKVKLGQAVTITADAFPGMSFHGEVERIATKGVNVSNVVTFEVRIEVQGENKSLLKPEMTANVEIIAAEKDDVLLVPEQAVIYKKGKAVVRVSKDDELEERQIKTGLSDGVMVEVTEGLTLGEVVAYREGESQSSWRNNRNGNNLSSGRGLRMIMGGGH